jgi:glycosyltransferase involved in cell wall biosynthesis
MPAPVRVLQLGSPNGMFGAERWILALARHLRAERVDTAIGVVQDAPGGGEAPLLSHARALGFGTVSIEAPGRLARGAAPRLRALIRERRIDVLHTHFYKTTVLGALAVRGTGCALLATPHGWSTGDGLRLQAYEWLERVAFGRADAVAPLSPELERGLRRLPWVRPRLVPIRNGVDLAEVRAAQTVHPEVLEARRRGEFVVGYLGQLIPRKRVDTLIEAFAGLESPRARLFVVGDGPERASLEAGARALGVADRVCFAGFRQDRLDWLRGFDALVLPSMLEGIPRCLMEAMAAEVAVAASDIPGTRELVTDGATGALFPPGDVAALRAVLRRLREAPVERGAMAARGRARVEAAFSAQAMARRYESLYDALARRGRAAPADLAQGSDLADPADRADRAD